MKAIILKSTIFSFFLFVISLSNLKAESNEFLYHNVEKTDNVISTTYLKGDAKSENLVPFKKKVNTLNEEGLCVSKVTYVWNSKKNTWAPFDKISYAYENGQVSGVSHSSWNERSNDWNEAAAMSYAQ